ncbi:MAG: hypothetical protein CSA70_09460 [Rhodobacterales bacterium]|nr:MAG: hypothetical protein CSA70_09460 [Rhodobacterales bacterium]
MMVLTGFLIGAIFGAVQAKRRKGKTLDILQYGAAYGIAFAILFLILNLIVLRNMG